MMDFEEFKASVADQIKDYLPEKYADATVALQDVTKNNDTVLTGLLSEPRTVISHPISTLRISLNSIRMEKIWGIFFSISLISV